MNWLRRRVRSSVDDAVQRPAMTLPNLGFSGDISLVHIGGMGRFWQNGETVIDNIEEHTASFLTGLYGVWKPFVFFIHGRPEKTSFFYGLPSSGNSSAAWSTLLSSSFPGCLFGNGPSPAKALQFLNSFKHVAAFTGNPSVTQQNAPTERESVHRTHLEPLLDVMQQSANWGYVVMARPVSLEAIESNLQTLSAHEREITQHYSRRNTSEQQDPQTHLFLDALRCGREKLLEGRLRGMWDVQTFVLTQTRRDLGAAAQALSGSLAGPESRPQPIELHLCRPSGMRPDDPATVTRLTSAECSLQVSLPASEYSGFEIREMARFSMAAPNQGSHAKSIAVGTISNTGAESTNWFQIQLRDLCQHLFIAGFTGSGKTVTAQYLLRQAWEEYRIPWLVLEPSMKSEYRNLLSSPMGGDLRIYTLGDESTVPFRINPLEVPQGVHLQTHLGGLSALFSAAFSFVTPMPDVLQAALTRVYRDLGWDFAKGLHPVLGYAAEVQPTLSDLIAAIDKIVHESGYGAEIAGNIRAGLQMRLNNLILGAKGLMLNTRRSVSIEEILSKPTVLEIGAMGDDEEAAFLAGLLLLRVVQHRQAQGMSHGELRHLMLIEEAHRLLRNTSQTFSTEEANGRGKAVETFCNMLAEVRAYGEGLIVVDQIPTKLAPDVIKNTRTKIIHRLVAEDDRRLIAGTMGLTETQQRLIASLPAGQAVVASEARPFRIRIPHHSRFCGFEHSHPDNARVRQHMKAVAPRAFTIPPIANPPSPQRNSLQMPKCPGCPAGTCSRQKTIFDRLTRVNFVTGFAQALPGGWESIWEYGTKTAIRIGHSKEMSAEIPFCVLMNMISLHPRLSPEEIEKFRRNLTILRERRRGQS